MQVSLLPPRTIHRNDISTSRYNAERTLCHPFETRLAGEWTDRGSVEKKGGGKKKKRKKKVISPHRITNDPGGTLLLRQRLFIIRQRFENVSARVVPSIILNTRAEHACTRNAWTRGTAPCPGTKHWFIDAFIRGERGANKSAGAYYFRKVNRSRAWPIGGEWIPQIYFPVFFVIFFLSLEEQKRGPQKWYRMERIESNFCWSFKCFQLLFEIIIYALIVIYNIL